MISDDSVMEAFYVRSLFIKANHILFMYIVLIFCLYFMLLKLDLYRLLVILLMSNHSLACMYETALSPTNCCFFFSLEILNHVFYIISAILPRISVQPYTSS